MVFCVTCRSDLSRIRIRPCSRKFAKRQNSSHTKNDPCLLKEHVTLYKPGKFELEFLISIHSLKLLFCFFVLMYSSTCIPTLHPNSTCIPSSTLPHSRYMYAKRVLLSIDSIFVLDVLKLITFLPFLFLEVQEEAPPFGRF